MSVHEAAWPRHAHSELTTVPGDVGVTATSIEPAQHLTFQHQDWAEMMSSYDQQSHVPITSNSMDPGLLNINDLPMHLGTFDDYAEPNSIPATTNSVLSLPFYDPASNSDLSQAWSGMHNAHTAGFDYTLPEHHHLLPWAPVKNFVQPSNCVDQQFGGPGIHMPLTSHPSHVPHAVPHGQAYIQRPSPVQLHDFGYSGRLEPYESTPAPQDDPFGIEEDHEGQESADPCYAQLLYQCLKEAPDHTLSLRDLYEWVSQHSQKARDPHNRGWQNSVRHNLSMNAAFVRVPHGTHNGAKKGSLWRLTEAALREGVISTTRYRKDPKRKPERRSAPALNRQVSGARGGRATRDATRLRQQQQDRLTHGLPYRNRPRTRHALNFSPSSHSRDTSPSSGLLSPTPAASPYFVDGSMQMPLPPSAPQTPPNQHPLWTTPPSDLQMIFENADRKPASFTNFDFLPLDYDHGGLFGDHDPELYQHSQMTTPSLITEASFMTDDNIPPSGMAYRETHNDHEHKPWA